MIVETKQDINFLLAATVLYAHVAVPSLGLPGTSCQSDLLGTVLKVGRPWVCQWVEPIIIRLSRDMPIQWVVAQ